MIAMLEHGTELSLYMVQLKCPMENCLEPILINYKPFLLVVRFTKTTEHFFKIEMIKYRMQGVFVG